MQGTTKNKGVLEKVISKLTPPQGKHSRLKHKMGWLEFLANGDLLFTSSQLYDVISAIVNKNPPEGKKLFCLSEKKSGFTVLSDKTPGRPEEALERFIVFSNPDNFYNQIPIGGRRESIDIGILESDEKFIFVELKPFESTNTPLYGILESLKNLIEYEYILKKGIKNIPRFKEVDLIVLAPKSYWDDYGINESGTLQKMKRVLNELGAEFGTNISLMALHIEKDEFFDKCRKICEQRGIDKQQRITISKADALPELARDRWQLLVASDRISTRN